MIKLTELGEDYEYSVWDGDVEVESHLTYMQASSIDDYIQMLRDQLNGKFAEAMANTKSIEAEQAWMAADALKLTAENKKLKALLRELLESGDFYNAAIEFDQFADKSYTGLYFKRKIEEIISEEE